MMKLNNKYKLLWSNKLFDKWYFFKKTREKKLICWDIFYQYRVFFNYSMNLGVCMHVKRKHIKKINTFFYFYIKYKYIKAYVGILYFLNGMIIDRQEYRIFYKFTKYSRLSKKRLFKYKYKNN